MSHYHQEEQTIFRPVALYFDPWPFYYGSSSSRCQNQDGIIQTVCDRPDDRSTKRQIDMSSADVDEPPESKRFRIDVNTQGGFDSPSASNACSVATPVAGEASQEGQSPAAPSSASYRSSNGSVVSSSDSPSKEEDVDSGELMNDESEGSTVGGASSTGTAASSAGPCDLLDILSKTMLTSVFGGVDDSLTRPNEMLNSLSASPTPQNSGIPGALAVAASPAAQLFSGDDWSWHRNPAASIRSGGTNKQTPVWKYFVYSKAENLSRCIVGDCTYMLKGPHTSTLACHLKKHTKEYSEFQKLKSEYSRTKLEIQASQPREQQIHRNGAISPDRSSVDIPIRPTKPKKENTPSKVNDMSAFLANAFRSNNNPINLNRSNHSQNQNMPPIPTSQLSSMPAIMQNMMMSMNPIQMMLAHSIPTSSAPNGMNALQQAGLSLANNGQIIQSKKWRGDEKKQRELQTKLALALATSHVSIEVIQNPMWKELFEMAQPKFNINVEMSSYEQIVNSISTRLHQSIRSQLGSVKKLNLLVDTTKITNEISRITVAAALPAGAGNSYEKQVILLGMKNLQPSDNMAEEISRSIDIVTAEYGITNETINRIVCSGIQDLVGEDCSNVVDKQLESFGSRLLGCLNHWLETSANVDSVKKSVFTMIFSVIANQSALQLATKISGGKFDIPITEPFPILAETIVSMRDCFQLNQVDGFVGMTEAQWTRLTGIHHVCNMFKPFVGYTNDMTTVDTIIPTLQQIQHALEKDIYQLGDMSGELSELLIERLAFITDPDCEEFDSTYVQATALNPQLAVILNQEQMVVARKVIDQEVSKRKRRRESSNIGKKLSIGVDSILANVIKSTSGEGLSIYGDLFQSMNSNSMDKEENRENMVDRYFDEIASTTPVDSIFTPILHPFGNPMQAPLAYWKSCSSKCADLAELAIEILSIPIFTISTERVLHFHPNPAPFINLNSNLILTNLDNSEQFEKQLLLRFNRNLVSKLL